MVPAALLSLVGLSAIGLFDPDVLLLGTGSYTSAVAGKHRIWFGCARLFVTRAVSAVSRGPCKYVATIRSHHNLFTLIFSYSCMNHV
jgi:hypothetical protein